MKIGIIGAPGSGKTELAEQIAKEKNLQVVDGYAERWSERTGLTIGYTGGYAHSLGVALERIFDENKLGDDFVTAGTTVDSLMHMALVSLKNPNKVEFIRAKTYMETIAMLYYDFWLYDHVFVCRLPQQEVKDEETAKDLLDNFELGGNLRYDAELDATLKSFATVEHTQLPADADRMQIVMEKLNADSDK